LELCDDARLDLAALARGRPATAPDGVAVYAFAILTGRRDPVSLEELDLLLTLRTDRWTRPAPHQAEIVSGLLERGLLVADSTEPALAEIREREHRLEACRWNLCAAFYHYMSIWEGVDVRSEGDEAMWLIPEDESRRYAEAYGPAPPPFEPRTPRDAAIGLPPPASDGALFGLLERRMTTRAFDTAAALSAEDLSTVMFWVFGAHGYARTLGDAIAIKRTSPSGGGLHPVDAYLLIAGVDGVDPGIYHYDGRHHALEPIARHEPPELRGMAADLMCGQWYFGDAHVSIVLTARFARSYWKYRASEKAYAAILMDAAHLSQTLYLVSAELGLGAFVTLAVNGRDVEARLGLDGVAEGVIAMAGLGPRLEGGSPREPRWAKRLEQI
jgi:putative peptide maturation dehydrogenase